MAYVTRCPYCGSVWLMPDKETADRTPVKCPDCNHSFDATCSLTAVPDSLFPGRVPVMLQARCRYRQKGTFFRDSGNCRGRKT